LNKTFIRESSNPKYSSAFITQMTVLILILVSIIFNQPLFTVILIIIGLLNFFFILLPLRKLGILINDDSLTLISDRSTKEFKWENITLVTHEIRVKYHVISLHEGERSLHISLEKYNKELLVNEVLKHVPKEKIEIDSLKNLDQYYYYGKTIERK
jgi:hypothetical protein